MAGFGPSSNVSASSRGEPVCRTVAPNSCDPAFTAAYEVTAPAATAAAGTPISQGFILRFIPACAAIASQFPIAGIFCRGGCVPDPTPAPHSSCENCGGESPPAGLPFQTPRCAPPAYPSQGQRRRRSLRRPCPRRFPARNRPAAPSPRPRPQSARPPPAAPAAPPRSAIPAHSLASRTAAAPQSPPRRTPYLSTRFAQPPAAQSAPPVPQNPPDVPAAPAAPAETHTPVGTNPAGTRSAPPALPDSGASPPPPARSL